MARLLMLTFPDGFSAIWVLLSYSVLLADRCNMSSDDCILYPIFDIEFNKDLVISYIKACVHVDKNISVFFGGWYLKIENSSHKYTSCKIYWDTNKRKAYSHDKNSHNVILCIHPPLLLILSCMGKYCITILDMLSKLQNNYSE